MPPMSVSHGSTGLVGWLPTSTCIVYVFGSMLLILLVLCPKSTPHLFSIAKMSYSRFLWLCNLNTYWNKVRLARVQGLKGWSREAENALLSVLSWVLRTVGFAVPLSISCSHLQIPWHRSRVIIRSTTTSAFTSPTRLLPMNQQIACSPDSLLSLETSADVCSFTISTACAGPSHRLCSYLNRCQNTRERTVNDDWKKLAKTRRDHSRNSAWIWHR